MLAESKIKFLDREYNNLEKICKGCANFNLSGIIEMPCEFLDCNVFYSKMVAKDKLAQIKPSLQKIVIEYENSIHNNMIV